MNRNKIIELIFALVIGIVGYIFLFNFDWKIGIAVILVIWSNNITLKYK